MGGAVSSPRATNCEQEPEQKSGGTGGRRLSLGGEKRGRRGSNRASDQEQKRCDAREDRHVLSSNEEKHEAQGPNTPLTPANTVVDERRPFASSPKALVKHSDSVSEYEFLKNIVHSEQKTGHSNEEIFTKLMEMSSSAHPGDEKKKSPILTACKSSDDISDSQLGVGSDRWAPPSVLEKSGSLDHEKVLISSLRRHSDFIAENATKRASENESGAARPHRNGSCGHAFGLRGEGKPMRRAQIFEAGLAADRLQFMMQTLGGPPQSPSADEMPPEVKLLVRSAFGKFLLLDEGEETDNASRMHRLLHAMKREVLAPKEYLMHQGEEGSKMYVVIEGSLSVIIDGQVIRSIGRGAKVGELALLYNEPRSADVIADEQCVLYSIRREMFKEVQALESAAHLIMRYNSLRTIPCLAPLDSLDLSKLAGICRVKSYRTGDIILRRGEKASTCFLVESGTVSAKSSVEGQSMPCSDVERLLICKRPECADTSGGLAGAKLQLPSLVLPPMEESNSVLAEPQEKLKNQGSPGISVITKFSPQANATEWITPEDICEQFWDEKSGTVTFGKGCFLGVPILLAYADLELDGLPSWEIDAANPAGDEKENEVLVFSPLDLVAHTDVRVSCFSIEDFERVVGDIGEKLERVQSSSVMRSARRSATMRLFFEMRQEVLKPEDFQYKSFLGQGSFGHVTVVTKKDGIRAGETFALKTLNKESVCQAGQVQHVLDEKEALEMLHQPFILRLDATFQDENNLYFLTEVLSGGELWSILYEGASGQGTSGLPPNHCQFYGAITVSALRYIHHKGLAYRDLKPENIVVDDTGYLRLIDLGFAKKIPYTATVNGRSQMQLLSHTMCGTPEYLAPEFVFQRGHDRSVDLWALGVLLFELVMAVTPFVPDSGPEDMTGLFTNIASVRRKGIPFPPRFDEKAGGADLRHLVLSLCAFEPADRLGNLAGRMDDIRRHPYFTNTDWDTLESKKLEAPWIPDEDVAVTMEPDEELMKKLTVRFQHDQNLFRSF